ncbi:Quinol monooxygenase YgiN [Nitrosospira sp. Nsp11]|nr:Quinol monooxygenase YgiN [Nitrosospira sp. Nsp11]
MGERTLFNLPVLPFAGNGMMSGVVPRCPTSEKKTIMLKVALFVRLQAKPGKETDVSNFLEQGLALANQEAETPVWFALRLGPSTFGVFDAFTDEAGRSAHLSGPIAEALSANAADLLAEPPQIEYIDVLGAKLPL